MTLKRLLPIPPKSRGLAGLTRPGQMLPDPRSFMCRHSRLLAAAAVLAFAMVPLRAQDHPTVAGTLPEDSLPGLKSLIQAALQQSPNMILADISVYQARAGALQTDSVFWPSITGGGGYGRNRDRVSETSNGQKLSTVDANGRLINPWSYSGAYNYNVSLSQNLFQWGALIERSKVAHLNVLINERQYAQAYQSLVVQIRDQFLNLISARINLRYSEFQLKITKDALAVAEEKLKSGIIPATAIQGPRLDLADQQLDYDRKVQLYTHAKRLLAQLAGLPDIDDSAIPLEMPRPLYSQAAVGDVLAAFMRDGARGTFQAQVYLMSIREDNLNYKIAQTNLLPHLFFSATAGQSSVTSINPGVAGGVTQSTVLSEGYNLGMSWNIFDGWSTRGQRRSALASRRSHERQLQSYAESTIEDAQDRSRQLDFAARAMDLAEQRRGMADAALQYEQGELKLGNAPQSTVDAAQAALYVNDYYQASARADLFSRWSAFVSLAGQDPALAVLANRYVRPVQ